MDHHSLRRVDGANLKIKFVRLSLSDSTAVSKLDLDSGLRNGRSFPEGYFSGKYI